MNPQAATAEPTARATGTNPKGLAPLSEEDLLDFVWLADPQISPDGSRIVFTRIHVDKEEDGYRTALWVVDAAGGEARPLTSGNWDSQARWSADGRRIAFVRVTEKGKPGQIHVLPMDGGEATQLTKLEKGAGSPAWSPDGRRIAFTSGANVALDLGPDGKPVEKPKNEPGRIVTRPVFRENNVGFYEFDHRDHLWVIDAAGGEPRQLTTGEYVESAPRWSRDGRRIFFVSDRRPEPWFGLDESRLWTVSPDLETPTDGASMTKVAEYRGPVNGYAEAADGRIATIGMELPDEPHAYDQWNVLLHSGEWPMTRPRVVNANRDYAFAEGVNSDQHPPRGGGEVPFAFTADGKALIVMGAREGASMLLRVEIDGGAIRELTPRGHDLVVGTGTADGSRWALTLGSPLRPGDLYLFDTASGALKKLYVPNDALLSQRALGTVEEFRYPSFDSAPIHGWIVTPPDFDPKKKYPMVLEIHGGPHTAYGVGFFHEFHALAGAGYVVLYTNPRGSTSYGWDFAHVIQYRYPGDDGTDLMCAVDAVVKRGFIDEKRIGVTGGSGGGLLTNWLITQTNRFASAITQRCVSEWGSMMQSCDFAMYTPFWFRKQPWQDPQEYAERSPMTYVDKITTPLMILHSEEDWRTPIAQGETMFRALKYLRKPVVMVRFPGENHELTRSGTPSRRVQNQQHIRRWFDRWMMGKDAPEYGV